jgi:hypothetical protein
MPVRRSSRVLTDAADETANYPVTETETMREISRLLNARLAHGRSQRKIIKHNAEAGQIAENVFRQVLRDTLPLRFGIAKGKLVNPKGELSRHLDVVIYDAMNCPALFLDENHNQLLPIEGAYAVIEVKSSTSKSAIVEAFEELASVAKIHPEKICSRNKMVDYFPPILEIFSFSDSRSLDAIHDNFVELNKQYPQEFSSLSYSKGSGGWKDLTGENYMVQSITVAEKGSVYHMLDGSTAIGRWGESTVSMLISSLLSALFEIKLPRYKPTSYLDWLRAGRREIYKAAPRAPA